MNSKNRFWLCSLALLFTAAIWGFAFVVVKDSLDYIGPVWMLAFRFSLAALVLCGIFIRELFRSSFRFWVHGAILGFYLFMAYLLQTIGCNYTTAGKNAFLTTIYVFLVPLFSWIFMKKKSPWYVFLCALMSLLGIALLALGTDDKSMVNIGDVLTLACGIFYAVHIIYTAKFNEEHNPVVLTALQFLFAAIFSWIAAPLMDGSFPLTQALSFRVVISMLYLGLFSTLVAFVLQNVGLKYLPSAWTSLLMSFESFFGVLFGVLLLGEKLTVRMMIGCALIFTAVVLAQALPELLEKNSEK